MIHDEGLQGGIGEDPNDYATRLIYADWLEERGEYERAEMIRTDIQAKKYPRYSLEWSTFQEKLAADGYYERTLGLINKIEANMRLQCGSVTVHLGLPEYVMFQERTYDSEELAHRLSNEYIRGLHIPHADPLPLLRTNIGGAPFGTRLVMLDVFQNSRILGQLDTILAECPHLRDFRAPGSLFPGEISALCMARLPMLEALNIAGCSSAAGHIRSILASHPNLKKIWIKNIALTDDDRAALEEAKNRGLVEGFDTN